MKLNISYKITGYGDSIIFIHGIGSRHYTWNGVIEELKDEYQCITYDLRGHGESVVDESNFTLEDLVEDLENLRSFLDINKIHIVGHSLGGMIGTFYAKKYRDRLLSLSLLSTTAFRNVDDKNKILNIISEIKNKNLDNVLPSLINRWFTDDFIKNNQYIIDRRFKQIQDMPLKFFLNVFRLYALTEMGSWLNKITIPCLVMTGKNDLGCNPNLNKKIAEALPNAKLEIIDNLKHAITLEAPGLVGKKIRKFLNNIKNYSTFDKETNSL